MLQLGSVYKGDLNVEIQKFLEECGTNESGSMIPFYQVGDEMQVIIDWKGGFDLNTWLTITPKVPKGLYLGKALVKVCLSGGVLMFPSVPELGSTEKGQKFGLPGVDLTRKHVGSQFIKFDLWQLFYPPHINITLKETGEMLVPLGAIETGSKWPNTGIRWWGLMNYTCEFGDEGQKMFCPLFTWDLSDLLPDAVKVEYQDKAVLVVNRDMKINGCYEQGMYFHSLPDKPQTTVKADVFSQIAMCI